MAKGKLLAEGTHVFMTDGSNTGRDTWQVSQLGHGGILLSSRGEVNSPQPRTWTCIFEVDKSWSPVSLSLRVESDGRVLTSNQRAESDRWLAEVNNGKETSNSELPFSPKHEIDAVFSTLFNTVTLLRTRLPVGKSQDLDVIYVDSSTLLPIPEAQRYECLAEEKIEVPAGSFPALKYRMTHLKDESGRVNEFWADHHGFVLLLKLEKEEIRLVQYRHTERR